MKPHTPQYIMPIDGHEYETINPEQEFGAKVLPWLGATLVILGLGFLVHYGIKHNWITPAMQMAGSALLSSLFAGIGLWLSRGENGTRFFGNLLIGLGSCGLYLTAVGGFTSWQLINSETMLGAFVGLSLLNLAYGFWRALPPFVLIGMVGGSIASGILGHTGRNEMSLAVLALVGLPSIASLAVRREPYWILPVWAAGFFSLMTWGETHHGYPFGIWLMAGLVAHSLANGRSSKPSDFVTPGAAAALALAGMNQFLPGDWVWTTYVAIMGICILTLAQFGPERSRNTLFLVGGTTVAYVSPFSLPLEWIVLFYAIAAPIWFGVTLKFPRLVFLGGTPLILVSLMATLALQSENFDSFMKPLEVPINIIYGTLMAAVIASATLVTIKERKRPESEAALMATRVAAVTLCAILAWKLSEMPSDPNYQGGTLSLVLTSFAAFGVGHFGRFIEVRIMGLILLVTAMTKLVAIDMSNMDAGLRVLALVGIGAAALAISYAVYIRPAAKAR